MTPEEIAASLIPEPWKSSTPTAIAEAAAAMIEHGMSASLTEATLAGVVGALRSEYGE